MEYYFPSVLKSLVTEFTKLPSIGEKSALRLAYHIVAKRPELAVTLAKSLIAAVETVKLCNNCFFFCEQETCVFCLDLKRTQESICVVEKPMDVIAIERTGLFRGQYHVLHGVWAPMRGLSAEDMKCAELIDRIERSANSENPVKEIILATSATVEGDATALYLSDLLSHKNITCSKLAQGVPKGGDLEYLDDVTLSRAFAGRILV